MGTVRGADGDAANRTSLDEYLRNHAEASLLGFRVILDGHVEAGTIVEVVRRGETHLMLARFPQRGGYGAR